MRSSAGTRDLTITTATRFPNLHPIEKLLYYSMSLPVSTVSVGMPKLEHIEQNIQLARKFKPLSEAERRQLSASIGEEHKLALESFFRHHVDA